MSDKPQLKRQLTISHDDPFAKIFLKTVKDAIEQQK